MRKALFDVDAAVRIQFTQIVRRAITAAVFIICAADLSRAEDNLTLLREGPASMESNTAVSPDAGLSLVESRNQLILLTDKGIEPAGLQMRVADSALFFLNKTSGSLLSLEIDYGKKTTHCASTNLTIGDDNIIRSTKPFAPRDFASVCFHDAGQYPFKLYGLKGKSEPLTGMIDVK